MQGFPSAEAVEAALRALGGHDPAAWAPVLAAACRKHGIDTPARVAAFLANVMHESGGLKAAVENLNYARSALPSVFGSGRGARAAAMGMGRPPGSKVRLSEEQQQALANSVYGGEWGRKNLGNTQANDGWFFRGRGLIQLTGRANYKRFADTIGVSIVDLPAILETREGAADSAAAFWAKAGCNACADAGDQRMARKRVNGGDLGLKEVEHHAAVAAKALTALA